MKKFSNSKELNEAIRSGKVKPSETVLLDERETDGISNNLDLISKNNRKADGRADFLEGYNKAKKEVLELIDEHRKRKYYLHSVDECGCCQKGLDNICDLLKGIEERQSKQRGNN